MFDKFLKMNEDSIRNIIYNDYNIEEYIKKEPQTCNSILNNYRNDGTFQVVLRRRISRLVKQNKVWRLLIPGTRGRRVIFKHPESKYIIIVLQGMFNINVHYFFDFYEDDEKIILKDFWDLSGEDWHFWQNIPQEKKIYKNKLRNNVFRIWK